MAGNDSVLLEVTIRVQRNPKFVNGRIKLSPLKSTCSLPVTKLQFLDIDMKLYFIPINGTQSYNAVSDMVHYI